MVYVISVLVVVAAFALVAWPLFRPPRVQREEEEPAPWQDLVSQRNTAYEAIKDLDFEYQLGNLSEEDYRALRGRYRRQAAEVLRRLDSLLRGDESRPQEEARPAPAPGAERPGRDRCPACSAQVQAEDRFCWRCGRPLRQRCPRCGRPFAAEDRFCARCGTPLKKRAEV